MDEFERMVRERVERMVRGILRDVVGVVGEAAKIFKPIARGVEEGYITPESDVYIEGDKVLVVAAIPGASKESIDVRVADASIDIMAEFSKELADKAPKASLFKYRGYRCSLPLPKPVEAEGARATYRDGILILELPLEKPKGVRLKID